MNFFRIEKPIIDFIAASPSSVWVSPPWPELKNMEIARHQKITWNYSEITFFLRINSLQIYVFPNLKAFQRQFAFGNPGRYVAYNAPKKFFIMIRQSSMDVESIKDFDGKLKALMKR